MAAEIEASTTKDRERGHKEESPFNIDHRWSMARQEQPPRAERQRIKTVAQFWKARPIKAKETSATD